ncbi:MAG: DUF3560 domain-containing protein [Desulfovibrio sp.]|jgi:hypothetical protein|nr:DUF3560 domain-containing protein [Desulfovibrio sp.]
MNSYEQKQEERRQRYLDLAEQSYQESAETHKRARKMAEVIPFGQPILIGHHSERSDRNYRGKIHRTFGKAFNLLDKAQYYERKAESVGQGGISADDPDAIKKLQVELASLEQAQEHMKEANAAIRRCKTQEERKTALVGLGFTEKQADELICPDFCGRVGFAPFSLSNNSANIRRIKDRIAGLEKLAARESQEEKTDLYEYREDKEENRIMFFFDGKPEDEIRAVLKRHGFKWSPTRKAWVRQLSANAVHAAKAVKEKFAAMRA